MDPDSVIKSAEWNTFAPSFIQLAANGPGVPPAQSMVYHANSMQPFAEATTVIDIGCGPGQITNELLKEYNTRLPKAARVVAADSHEEMLSQVRARQQREIGQGNAYWSRAEIQKCDVFEMSGFPEGSASHVLAGFLLFTLPTPEKALATIKRTLAPNGVVAFSSLQESEWQDLMNFPSKVRADQVMPKMPSNWTTEAGIRRELESAGFRDVAVHKVTTYMPFEDWDEICRFILLKFPIMARMASNMTSEEVVKTRDLMVKHLKDKYPTVPNRMSGTALIGYGRK